MYSRWMPNNPIPNEFQSQKVNQISKLPIPLTLKSLIPRTPLFTTNHVKLFWNGFAEIIFFSPISLILWTPFLLDILLQRSKAPSQVQSTIWTALLLNRVNSSNSLHVDSLHKILSFPDVYYVLFPHNQLHTCSLNSSATVSLWKFLFRNSGEWWMYHP